MTTSVEIPGSPGQLRLLVEPILRQALAEDLGVAGDITTDALVPAGTQARGRIILRGTGRVAGLAEALHVFGLLDGGVGASILVADGTDVAAGTCVAEVIGDARSILTGERVALNLLGRMAGIATATAKLAALVAGTGVQVACTRKTTPGLRGLEKKAVRLGGGAPHRYGLDDAILIKDNHLAVVGSVTKAVEMARRAAGHLVKVEVEVTDLAGLAEALAAGADAVLLDNMSIGQLEEAVTTAAGRVLLEASGGITAANIQAVAATGVDVVSVGWLTHSAPALDVALDFLPA